MKSLALSIFLDLPTPGSVRKRHRENRVTLPVCNFQFSTPTWSCRLAVQITDAAPVRRAWKVGVSVLAATLTTPDPRHHPHTARTSHHHLSVLTCSCNPASILLRLFATAYPKLSSFGAFTPAPGPAVRPLTFQHRTVT